ncbi:M4 family metallopeptidase [Nocardioides gansuensis]|uniref:M4 family metallopeptidase n=1 Tax=Nocardioides gansuensis TaxID=2138300 RepID=UPI0014042061|nr:M4 family metallopeptidase [Nocardioides gansuensis]
MASTRARCLAVGVPLAVTATLLSIAHNGSAAPPGPDRALVARQDETGKVGFIGTRAGEPIDVGLADDAGPGSVATTLLRRRAAGLGLSSARTGLRVTGQHPAAGGGTSVRVAQQYAGIPVFGGEFTVNLDRHDDVLSVLGEASPIAEARTTPVVSAREARAAAIAAVGKGEGVATDQLTAATPTLTYYDPRLLDAPGAFQTARLSWVTEVRAARPAISHTVVVDAERLRVSLDFSNLAHARNRSVCDANNTPTQVPCLVPLRTEGSPPLATDEADVRLAFDYAGDTYDFFLSRFGRDSLDGAGMPLVSTVDYCDPSSRCPFKNAFWDGSQMVYGDGYASADDVVGHELAHGVTDFSSSLFYYYQSGAINEAMSDIFGELIDLTNGKGGDTSGVRWLMGEDLPIGAIRDMQDPPAYDQPDRMQSPLYWPEESDSGGVHTNSGVANKAAYLLADGDTFNGRTISPVGSTKTARLFYTVNNDFLVSGSDYADLARALRQACTNLASAGTDGFTPADCTQVDQAILATEMDHNPAQAPTTDPELCPPGHSPAMTMHDSLESPSGQFTITPAVAEVWSYPQNPNDYPGYDATYATSGQTNIWGDDPAFVSDSALAMTAPVTVPAGGLLHFRHAYGFEDDPFDTYDGGVLEYSVAGGAWQDAAALIASGGYTGTISGGFDNPLGGRQAFVGESNGYGSTLVDLSGLAGQPVRFRWRIGTDSMVGDAGWFIDDLAIYRCDAPPPPSPVPAPTTTAPGPLLDVTAPNTRITEKPRKRTFSRKAKLAFRSTEAGSTFQCKLDRSKWKSCTSPKKYKKLKLGKHSFSVRATDRAGNVDPRPAKAKWVVRRR